MADALTIVSKPPVTFYDTSRPSSGADLAWPRLIDVSEISSELRISGGETPNARIRLDNGSGELTDRLSPPPLRAEATILRDGIELFRGIVAGVELGPVITVDIEV